MSVTLEFPESQGMLIGQFIFHKSAVEYVSPTGLQPETIVSRLKEKLGDRLAHKADSYEKIGAYRWSLSIIRNGYKPTHYLSSSVPEGLQG